MGVRLWNVLKYVHEIDEPWYLGFTFRKPSGEVEWDILRLISPLEWLGLAVRRLSHAVVRRWQWPVHGMVPSDVSGSNANKCLSVGGLEGLFLAPGVSQTSFFGSGHD